MTGTYKLFRTYCITAIISLCLLLLSVGVCTAKFRTDEAAFKANYSTVSVFTAQDDVTVNLGGRIMNFSPQKVTKAIEKSRPIVLAPVNDIIEILKQLKDISLPK
ncbi:MAG: hypothetical protein ACI4GA_04760 [Acutalibacteraceae bacterium]|nr:hypothetical protein [Oscillospiraceae bacterium]